MSPTASTDDDGFRREVRGWLAEHLVGDWAHLKGVGGSGSGEEAYDERRAWNRHLAEHGWTCLGWPAQHGGRGLSLAHQAIFHEEYARADAPEMVNHLGEHLLGPTLIEFGTDAQKERFLPGIRTVDELWCQGYSEPGAGSDLSAVSTRAVLDEAAGEWVLDGQKVWTSWAHQSDWIFVLARSEPGSSRHHGLSFLLVPLDQDGIQIRPIEQITGGSEFNEVFLDGARTPAEMIVGEPGDGWRVAMALLGFERGVSVLGQQVGFERELNALIDLARGNGSLDDPVLRDRLAQQSAEFEVMRVNAVRSLTEATPGADNVAKLVWSGWHRRLGELAMEVSGADSLTATGASYDLDRWQSLFLFSRADTLYGGSDEIQRNILAERVLGLPKEPRG